MDLSVIISIISLFFSLIAAVISGGIIYYAHKKGWHKSRVHYDINHERYFTRNDPQSNQELLDKLNTGKYEILSVDSHPDHVNLVISRVKEE